MSVSSWTSLRLQLIYSRCRTASFSYWPTKGICEGCHRSGCGGFNWSHIPNLWSRLEAVEALKSKPDFEPLAVAFKRVVNILRKLGNLDGPESGGKVKEDLFEHKSESALLSAYQKVEKDAFFEGWWCWPKIKTCAATDGVTRKHRRTVWQFCGLLQIEYIKYIITNSYHLFLPSG